MKTRMLLLLALFATAFAGTEHCFKEDGASAVPVTCTPEGAKKCGWVEDGDNTGAMLCHEKYEAAVKALDDADKPTTCEGWMDWAMPKAAGSCSDDTKKTKDECEADDGNRRRLAPFGTWTDGDRVATVTECVGYEKYGSCPAGSCADKDGKDVATPTTAKECTDDADTNKWTAAAAEPVWTGTDDNGCDFDNGNICKPFADCIDAKWTPKCEDADKKSLVPEACVPCANMGFCWEDMQKADKDAQEKEAARRKALTDDEKAAEDKKIADDAKAALDAETERRGKLTDDEKKAEDDAKPLKDCKASIAAATVKGAKHDSCVAAYKDVKMGECECACYGPGDAGSGWQPKKGEQEKDKCDDSKSEDKGTCGLAADAAGGADATNCTAAADEDACGKAKDDGAGTPADEKTCLWTADVVVTKSTLKWDCMPPATKMIGKCDTTATWGENKTKSVYTTCPPYLACAKRPEGGTDGAGGTTEGTTKPAPKSPTMTKDQQTAIQEALGDKFKEGLFDKDGNFDKTKLEALEDADVDKICDLDSVEKATCDKIKAFRSHKDTTDTSSAFMVGTSLVSLIALLF